MTTSLQANPIAPSDAEFAGEAFFVEQARAYYRDLKAVAENAPFGQTFDKVEDAIIPASQKLVQHSSKSLCKNRSMILKKNETRSGVRQAA